MATKNKSKAILKLKYLLIIPLLASMLLYTSCEKTEDIKQEIDSKVYDIKELDKSPYLEGSTAQDSKRKIEMILNISQEIFKHTKQIKSDNIKSNYLAFVINESGKVESIDYSNISKEDKTIAKEIISSLPNFKPGIKKGKPVKTQMKFPFIGYTVVEEEKETFPFSVIENVPVYPGCAGTNEELKKCMSKKITQHVSKTFDVGLANTLNLKAGRKRISIQFKINKEGNITDIKARAPHLELKQEAIRVIKTLPKMKPGKHDGKAVNVRYNLPIIFNVEGNTKNSVILEGTINGQFGFLKMSKKTLKNGDIAALSYSKNTTHDIVSFSVVINDKVYKNKGNMFNNKTKKALDKLAAGNRVKINNIKVAGSDAYVEQIMIKIK